MLLKRLYGLFIEHTAISLQMKIQATPFMRRSTNSLQLSAFYKAVTRMHA